MRGMDNKVAVAQLKEIGSNISRKGRNHTADFIYGCDILLNGIDGLR